MEQLAVRDVFRLAVDELEAFRRCTMIGAL